MTAFLLSETKTEQMRACWLKCHFVSLFLHSTVSFGSVGQELLKSPLILLIFLFPFQTCRFRAPTYCRKLWWSVWRIVLCEMHFEKCRKNHICLKSSGNTTNYITSRTTGPASLNFSLIVLFFMFECVFFFFSRFFSLLMHHSYWNAADMKTLFHAYHDDITQKKLFLIGCSYLRSLKG